MHQITINIPDEAYDTASKRARQEGFENTDVFLADLLVNQITADQDNFDYFFTPAIVAEIDAAVAEARSGNNVTLDQVRAKIAAKRQEWLANHHA